MKKTGCVEGESRKKGRHAKSDKWNRRSPIN